MGHNAKFLAAALLAAAPLAASGWGEPDPSYVHAIGLGCDGPPKVLGDSSILYAFDRSTFARLWRVRPDGSRDTRWGPNGESHIWRTDARGGERNMTILESTDGSFLVAGERTVVRIRRDGSLDRDFGGAGGVLTYPAGVTLVSASATPDGGMVALLSDGLLSPGYFVRIRADGLYDASFGEGGRLVVAPPGFVYAWGVQGDGRVQVGVLDQVTRAPRLRRLPDDFLPSERAGVGLMPRDVVATWAHAGAKVDTRGRVLLFVGYSWVRYDASGRPDVAFNQAIRDWSLGNVRAMFLSGDGKITLFVWQNTSGFGRFSDYTRALRFDDAGRIDPSFPSRSFGDHATQVAQQHDGKFLVVLNTEGCRPRRIEGDHPRADAELVEYEDRGRYFVTANGPETALLDGETADPRLRRTGRSLGAWLDAARLEGSVPMCRFTGDPQAGPRGHFYSLEGGECALVRADGASLPAGTRAWRFEGHAFSAVPAAADGSCPGELQPVRRLFNDGFRRGIDPNHRFATDPGLIEEMRAQGWILEGVAFCATLAPR